MSLWKGAFRLVLASGSPTRRRLLESAGLPFEINVPNVDERRVETELGPAGPETIACALANAKALAVSAQVPDATVLGADQVLSLDGEIFHKSPTHEAAVRALGKLAGRTHRLTSAFSLARNSEIVESGVEAAEMTMRPLGDDAIRRYLEAAGSQALGSVGAYQWEGIGAHLFEKVVGDHSTILGLPMLSLLAALRRLGALEL